MMALVEVFACATSTATVPDPPKAALDSVFEGPTQTSSDDLPAEEQEARCLGHEASSCTALASRYRVGDGAVRDPAFAALLYRHACELGDPGACHHLGNMYFMGDGMPQDAGRALNLYDKLCDDGLPTACQVIGWLFESGLGVTKDLNAAKSYYERACSGGFEEGCRRLRALGQRLLDMPPLPLIDVK